MNYDLLIEILLGLGWITTGFFLYRVKTKLQKIVKSLTIDLGDHKTHVSELQKRLDYYIRPRQGVVAKWEKAQESQSSYTLNVYNDTLGRAFNISLEQPLMFRHCSTINIPEKMVDMNEELKIYFLPKRRDFVHTWIAVGLEPIEFTLRYTESPELANIKEVKVFLKVEDTATHLQQQLKGR